MSLKDKLLAQRIYLFLGALFITSLVVSNLIFQKFFYWYPVDIEIFGSNLFEISVGILPYPIKVLFSLFLLPPLLGWVGRPVVFFKGSCGRRILIQY